MLTLLLAIALHAAPYHVPTPPPAGVPIPACVTEDSSFCYWDAQRHGNGRGRSFWTDADGNVNFWDEMA